MLEKLKLKHPKKDCVLFTGRGYMLLSLHLRQQVSDNSHVDLPCIPGKASML